MGLDSNCVRLHLFLLGSLEIGLIGEKMIKAVFFDLDGTLCDSDTAWGIAVKETFQLLRKQEPSVSEEALTNAWTTVLQKLFQQLNAGKCSMAEVRDSRFPCLFKELGLPHR